MEKKQGVATSEVEVSYGVGRIGTKNHTEEEDAQGDDTAVYKGTKIDASLIREAIPLG